MAVTLCRFINNYLELSSGENCAICQEGLRYGPRRVSVQHQDQPVNHYFHRACVEEWICDLEHPTCPLCSKIVTHINGLPPNKARTHHIQEFSLRGAETIAVTITNDFLFDESFFERPITDQSFEALSKSREVCIHNCPRITDHAIQLIPETTRRLSLENCNKLTNAIFDHMPPNLSHLHIAKCQRISLAALFTYKLEHPWVTVTYRSPDSLIEG